MKLISLFIPLLLSFSSLASGMDLADFDALQVKRREMENKELQLSQKRDLLLELNKRVAVLRNVQGKMLMGPNGLVAQTSDWTKQADQWLSAWSDLLNASDISESSLENQSAAELSRLFSSFEVSYSDLLKSNSQLLSKIEDLQSLLSELDDLPTNAYPAMSQQVAGLNLQRSKLIETTNLLTKNIRGFDSDNYQEKVQKIQTYIFGRIALAKMKFPQLKTALSSLEETLKFETHFRGKLGELDRLSADTKESLRSLKLYKTQSDFAKLSDRKNQILAELADKTVPARLSRAFVQKINDDYSVLKASVENFNVRYPGRNAFVRFAEKERAQLTAECIDTDTRMLLDCELLRTLNQVKIDDESVKSLSDSDLKYFENQIIKVRSSAGVGAAAK
ncbi:MAG: hypothetical protein EOP04_04225 [Proteobacteria bacterium]|nr:MAG: hypothetical protein EOP04_04225 [Pseudomonadota bacterium]